MGFWEIMLAWFTWNVLAPVAALIAALVVLVIIIAWNNTRQEKRSL